MIWKAFILAYTCIGYTVMRNRYHWDVHKEGWIQHSRTMKDKLQKLLDVGFIYPLLGNEWVSPLLIFPNKSVCNFRELNTAIRKYHFWLRFIDQVLESLAIKRYFSFLDRFSGYNQIKISPEDQDKTTFTCPWGTYAYLVLPFELCNGLATFQRAISSIFLDFSRDTMEIYMDDFKTYGSNY